MRALLVGAWIGLACGGAALAAPGADGEARPEASAAGGADDWAADRYFDPATMAAARAALTAEHGGGRFTMVLADIAEYRSGGAFRWDGEAWAGGDVHRLVLKTGGEVGTEGALEGGEVQALYRRAVGPYSDMLAGVRQDLTSPARTYAVLGLEGVAPYVIETEAAAFLSSHGELFAQAAAESDLRITQRLILQPRAEINFAFQNSPTLGIGAGLSDVEAGLRLRYEIVRQFAPYVGVDWSRSIGRTARHKRIAGEGAGGLHLVAASGRGSDRAGLRAAP